MSTSAPKDLIRLATIVSLCLLAACDIRTPDEWCRDERGLAESIKQCENRQDCRVTPTDLQNLATYQKGCGPI